jgi:hypothetical protein
LAPARMSSPSGLSSDLCFLWLRRVRSTMICSQRMYRQRTNHTVDIMGDRQVATLLRRRFTLPHASGRSVSSMQTLTLPVCRGTWSSGRLVALCPSQPPPLSLPPKKKKPWARSEIYLGRLIRRFTPREIATLDR